MVKTRWEDVTLGEFLDLEEIRKDDSLDDEDRVINILAVLGLDDPLSIPFTDFQKVIKQSLFINTPIPKADLKLKYDLNGTVYKLNTNIGGITTAQFIDFQNILKEKEELDIPAVLSVFLIPKDHKYNDGYDIMLVRHNIRNYMMAIDAMSIHAFFLNYYKAYTTSILSYFKKRMKKLKKSEEKEKLMSNIDRMIKALGDYSPSC